MAASCLHLSTSISKLQADTEPHGDAVDARTAPRSPAMLRQMAAVRLSCQTIALCSGRPVARSQVSVVSRWLVIPSAATFTLPTAARAAESAPSTQLHTLSHISSGSCSHHLSPKQFLAQHEA